MRWWGFASPPDEGIGTAGSSRRSLRAPLHHGFGLHAFTFDPLTPLQSWSARQSSAFWHVRTQLIAVPATESQIDPSGQPDVLPDIVQLFVQ